MIKDKDYACVVKVSRMVEICLI